MDTDELSAFRTGPSFFLISDKLAYTELFYILEIGDHTHTVFVSIALIQTFQPGARKICATEAVFVSHGANSVTILDSACDAGFRFETVVFPATGACVFLSFVRIAETAIHSAWGDHRDWDSLYLC